MQEKIMKLLAELLADQEGAEVWIKSSGEDL